MEQRKLIALDLDGTLLNSESRTTSRTRAVLSELKAQGQKIAIVTGRNVGAAKLATEGAEFANYLITHGGASIYDLDQGRSIYAQAIPQDETRAIMAQFGDRLRYFEVCDDEYYWRFYPKHDGYGEYAKLVRIAEVPDEVFGQCGEIGHVNLVPYDGMIEDDLARQIEATLANARLIRMQDSFSDRQWLEMLPKGCAKSVALGHLAEQLEMQVKDVIAFGDGLNDIDMLEYSGESVAMANALPEVKAIAGDVTDFDHDHDGVVEYLLKYFDW